MSPPRYSVTVRRDLIAQHFLVGGDWGRENELNSHRYEIEARYEGPSLDEHGFLVDIDAVGTALDALEVTVWEDGSAAAGYQRTLGSGA
jgi:6-pyruvoyl-tetrahydropterin synthase